MLFVTNRTPLYDLQTGTVVAVTGRVGKGGLVVDQTRNVVYWSDTTLGRIESAHTDGRGRKVVYETSWALEALAINPTHGYVV